MAGPYDSYALRARQAAAQQRVGGGKHRADEIGGYITGGIGGVVGAMAGGPLGAYQGWGAGRRFGEAAVGGHREFFGGGAQEAVDAFGRGDLLGAKAPVQQFGMSGAEAVSSAVKGQGGMIGGLTQGPGTQGGVMGQDVRGMETAFPATGDYYRYKTEGVRGEVDVPGFYQQYGTGSQPVSTGQIVQKSGGFNPVAGFSGDQIAQLAEMF